MFELLLAKAAAITDPYEQTLFLMVQLPYLQPFIDVNKRTSRLAANIPLIKLNLVPLSFVDVPERAYTQSVMAVYEFNRVELIRDVSLSEPDLSWLKYRTALREVIGSIIKDSERNLLSERFVSTLDSKYRRLICSDSAKWLCRSAGFARRQLRTLRPAKFRAWLSNRGGNTLTKS